MQPDQQTPTEPVIADQTNQPSAVTNTQEQTAVPSTWPGAFGLYKFSRQVVMANVWPILALSILSLVASGIGNADQVMKHNSSAPVIDIIGSLASVWISLALVYAYLAGVRSEKVSIGQTFARTAPVYIKGLVNIVLVLILLGVSFIAFVIPFLFVMPRLTLTTYYVVDKGMGPIEAIKASWRDTKGYSLKAWGIILVTALFAILIFVLVGFYLLFMYQAAFAVLYAFIARTKAATPPPAGVSEGTTAAA